MKWCIVVAALCCAAASAQVVGQNASKLAPYQMQALQNALRSPKAPAANSFSAPFAKLPPLSAQKLLPPEAAPSVEVAKACAIPLRRVPADPKIDPDIQRKLPAEAFSMDHMPPAKALPVCRPDNVTP